jgi:hypothetical protein
MPAKEKTKTKARALPPYDPNIVSTGQRFDESDQRWMTSPDWLPTTRFEWLEKQRAKQAQLLDQQDRENRALAALRKSFAEEDVQVQAALDDAFKAGTPDNPREVAVTSHRERDRQLQLQDRRCDAAATAVLSFGFDLVDELRGDLPAGWVGNQAVNAKQVPPDGHAAQMIAELEIETIAAEQRIAKAQAVIDTAAHQIRSAQPLTMWLIRTANAGVDRTVHLEPGSSLAVPVLHTDMSKPANLGVKDWVTDNYGDEPSDTAEVGTIDESDDWFAQKEAELAVAQPDALRDEF